MVIPIFEIKMSKKPIAIIKGGDRQLSFVKINSYNSKYFTTKDKKIFEIDDEYEYRFKKSGVYFYNFANSKPLDLTAMQEIDSTLKDNGTAELFNKQRFVASVGNDPSIDVSKLDLPKDLENTMSPDTRRFLQDHSTDDETTKTDIMIKIHSQKAAIEKYSSNLLGMGMNRGDWAFVQIGYRKLDIVRMYVNNDRAYTKYGVFEIDRDNIYLVKKQLVCFFVVSNEREKLEESMPKYAEKMMKTMVKNKRYKELETFIKPKKVKKNDNGLPDLEDLNDPIKIPKNVTLSSEKKLVQHQADSPSGYYTTLQELYLSKQAVATNLSDPMKKVIPIALVFGAVMGLAVLVSNMPPIIDEIADILGLSPPKIVYLSPEEARKAGFDPTSLPLAPEKEVTLADTMPPDLEAPIISCIPMVNEDGNKAVQGECPDLFFEADNFNGYKIEYKKPIVTDNVDEGLIAECSPPSRSIQTIGEHIVTCTAIDSSDNYAEVKFKITITVREGIEPGSIIPNIQPMP